MIGAWLLSESRAPISLMRGIKAIEPPRAPRIQVKQNDILTLALLASWRFNLFYGLNICN
jgi:hypothetical protein